MDIEFDTAKDAINRKKHSVSLAFGERVFDDLLHIVIPSFRLIDGEERYKAVGLVMGQSWTAVHVRRGTGTRFLSVKRSNDGKRRNYYRHSSGPG